MAYLDEDILYNNVEEKYKSAKGKAREAYSDVLDTICEMPRADVVPKSEYDNLKIQFEALDRECDRLEKAESEKHDKFIEAKAEVAREIFEELARKSTYVFPTRLYTIAKRDVDELKKKYTEVAE